MTQSQNCLFSVMAEAKPEGKLDFDDETSKGEENKLFHPKFY